MNLEPESLSLIRNLFSPEEFIDCAQSIDQSERIDVIIPVLHSNDLWHENLTSFYREIPINRLIIGNAGCIDETIPIAQKFPRVEVVNHENIKTLGASIADLIERVTTPKFAYLQSDVFLPNGWFSAMRLKSEDYAWVGSPMQVVTMLDHKVDYSGKRPLAGAQLGTTKAFLGLNEFLADDFVYRQEDFVLEEYVKKAGHNSGNSFETFHFHQVMRRNTSGMRMNVRNISIQLAESDHEKQRVRDTQLNGFLKYCDPKNSEVKRAAYGAYAENSSGRIRRVKKAIFFAKNHNKAWISLILRFEVKRTISHAMNILTALATKITDTFLGLQ